MNKKVAPHDIHEEPFRLSLNLPVNFSLSAGIYTRKLTFTVHLHPTSTDR